MQAAVRFPVPNAAFPLQVFLCLGFGLGELGESAADRNRQVSADLLFVLGHSHVVSGRAVGEVAVFSDPFRPLTVADLLLGLDQQLAGGNGMLHHRRRVALHSLVRFDDLRRVLVDDREGLLI